MTRLCQSKPLERFPAKPLLVVAALTLCLLAAPLAEAQSGSVTTLEQSPTAYGIDLSLVGAIPSKAPAGR